MTLDPHHFQQWDRHRSDDLNARIRAASPSAWGIAELAIDESRLSNGELALQACSGVMPDGLVFDVPDGSPLPDPRNVHDHLPPTEDRMRVELAIPSDREEGRNVQLQGTNHQRETRWVAESYEVSDENTGSNTRPVEVARTNVQLRFASESLQGYSTIPIAEIIRKEGGFGLSDRFLPPCLHLNASARLMELTRQMLELLVSKSTSLSEHKDNAFAQRELSPSDITALNLLGTIRGYIPQLNQLHAGGHEHPRDLFRILVALAGELSTYIQSSPVHPRDLPTYDHNVPSEGFNRIETILRQMLGEATPSSNYERVPLKRRRESLLVASVQPKLLEEAQLFLATRSDNHSEEQLTNALPSMLRIASPDTIEKVLQSYTRALEVSATRRLPTGMPVDSQATYFRLEKRGPFWDSIVDEQALAIFLPSDFRDLDVGLMAAL
jgi:type VI secretion system protein ImpJ